MPGGFTFVAKYSGTPNVRCWLCIERSHFDELWEQASNTAIDERVVLARPKGVPWLAGTIEMSAIPIAMKNISVFVESGDLGRCVAWVLLEQQELLALCLASNAIYSFNKGTRDMKAIIEGFLYETEADTVREIGEASSPCGRGYPEWWEAALYRTDSGRYFVAAEGNAGFRYRREGEPSGSGAGEAIYPMTPEEALAWAEKHLDAGESEAAFEEQIKDA